MRSLTADTGIWWARHARRCAFHVSANVTHRGEVPCARTIVHKRLRFALISFASLFRGTVSPHRRGIAFIAPAPAPPLQICGIMNGTTNFMMSKMEGEGADYGEVLKEAQDLGYAEGGLRSSCLPPPHPHVSLVCLGCVRVAEEQHRAERRSARRPTSSPLDRLPLQDRSACPSRRFFVVWRRVPATKFT